jgi:D-glycero-alpha-D-manno-heptose-7-phosphate kinase
VEEPLKVINSAAPIRICDNGGWTDTWFAGHGQVFNVAVEPPAEVQIQVFARDRRSEAGQVILHAENFGDRYAPALDGSGWGRHPLLEATIQRVGVPDDVAVEISIFSEAPSGASTGTSAAVTVALAGALDCLTPGRLTPHEVAYLAHSVEVDMLGQQCGVQDQLCAAYGGINYIKILHYPQAVVSQLEVPDAVWWELERRLVLIYLGRSHSSSQVHEKVVQELESSGPGSRRLQDLRRAAAWSCDAVCAGDFQGLGKAMIANSEAQGRLHPDLISADARRVFEIAQEHGAVGWKVNGAGGEGGSVTLLCSSVQAAKRAMIREIEEESDLFRNIPIRLSRCGLHTWE